MDSPFDFKPRRLPLLALLAGILATQPWSVQFDPATGFTVTDGAAEARRGSDDGGNSGSGSDHDSDDDSDSDDSGDDDSDGGDDRGDDDDSGSDDDSDDDNSGGGRGGDDHGGDDDSGSDDSDDDSSGRGDDDNDDDHSGRDGHDDDDDHSGRNGHDDDDDTPTTGGGSGGNPGVVKSEIDSDGIEITYSDGSKEEIESGFYERKDSTGRTVEERPATQADVNRLNDLL